ncbi:MAG: hypothetical protein M3321_09085 [Actinomycetota bacterium]|nr:hypothetical protein [Actinomycetota bacterium]
MAEQRRCATAEEAARGDIPERYARALATATSPDRTAAVVLLETNEPPSVEIYEVVCVKRAGGWVDFGGGGGFGIGWTSTARDPERNLGVVKLSGQAPSGAVAVVVAFGGREHRVDVSGDGYFVFASWDEPDTALENDAPEPVRYVLADGSSVPAPEGDRHGATFRRLSERMRARHWDSG